MYVCIYVYDSYLNMNFALLSFCSANFSMTFLLKSLISVTSLFSIDSMPAAEFLSQVGRAQAPLHPVVPPLNASRMGG